MNKTNNNIRLLITMILAGLLFPIFIFIVLCVMRLQVFALYYAMMYFAFSTWSLVSFFYYRNVRQEEFQNLLQSTFEADKPIIPMLTNYLIDRPKGYLREFIIVCFLSFMNPAYYLIYYRYWRFEMRVAGVISLLEEGLPLTKALTAYPGLVSQEVYLAISLGESSGNISSCFSMVGRWHKDLFWLIVLPRLAYLFFMVIATLNVAVFFMIFIAPKFERIFKDFDYALPWVTLVLLKIFNWLPTFGQRGNIVAEFGPLIWVIVAVFIPFFAALPFWNMTARWYFPIVGSIYRIHLQGNFLKMLGITLQGQTVISKALTFLEESNCFSGPAQKQLVKLNSSIKLGSSLEESLTSSGWLPKSMKPFIQSAQKVNNLPWALTEIGNQRLRLASLFAQRFSLVVFPLLMLLLGAMIGFIAIAMFMPLIKMIVELS